MALKAIILQDLLSRDTSTIVYEGDVVELTHLDREKGEAWAIRDYDGFYFSCPAKDVILIGEQRQ